MISSFDIKYFEAHNEQVHNYLRANHLSRFIPPTYTYSKGDPRYAVDKAETKALTKQNHRKRHRN